MLLRFKLLVTNCRIGLTARRLIVGVLIVLDIMHYVIGVLRETLALRDLLTPTPGEFISSNYTVPC